MCCRINLESDMDCRHGVSGGAFGENEIGISSEPGDDMASRPGGDMIANLKARTALRVRHAVFVIGVKEGVMGDLVGRHEEEECFGMGKGKGFCRHGKGKNEKKKRRL